MRAGRLRDVAKARKHRPTGRGARHGETATESALLARIAQAGEAEVPPTGPVHRQVVQDVRRPSDGDDCHALTGEIATVELGDRLERGAVARPFDEHGSPDAIADLERVHRVSFT